MPDITERGELLAARISAAGAVVLAGYLGLDPPGFVGETVAFAFGLAASSFFPAIVLGIFSTRVGGLAAVPGMLAGIGSTAAYIVWFKFLHPELNGPDNWFLGVSPEGFGTIGMLINLAVTLTLTSITPPPRAETQQMVLGIRVPRRGD